MAPARVSVVVVTYNSRDAMAATVPALTAQLREGDELVVVDNASADGTLEAVGALAPDAVLVQTGANLGFAAGAHAGAAAASGDLLVFLNPDAVPAAGFRDAIAAPCSGAWVAWMGLVTAEGGRIVNTNGGVTHFTAIAWAGEAGAPAPGSATAPREVGFLSGACLAIPRAEWERSGGFEPSYFMYHEDVDLSLRLRSTGGRIGVVPAARVDHDYAFAKGEAKWRLLERNRWATLLRTYPAPLLALVAPVLVAGELALLAAAARGGWLRSKLLADADVVRALPALLRARRAVQARRTVTARAFAAALVPELSSPYLGAAGRSPLLNGLLRAYWRGVLALLS